MKKVILPALIGLIIGASTVWLARATSQVFLGTLSSVNGTNNSGIVWSGTMNLPHGTFYFQNGGLTNGVTNGYWANIQIAFDTNFTTATTLTVYYPATTNATTDVFAPYLIAPFYLRAQTVTTNPVNVLGSWSYP